MSSPSVFSHQDFFLSTHLSGSLPALSRVCIRRADENLSAGRRTDSVKTKPAALQRARKVMNSQLGNNAVKRQRNICALRMPENEFTNMFLSSDTARSANLICPVNTSLIVIHERSCWFADTSSQRLIFFFSGDSYSSSDCRPRARGGGSRLSESVKNEL